METVVTAILVLSVLIVIHELGHFIVAKRRGVGVEKFSVGFGPKVFGLTRNGTEYRLSAIPFGGYVKMVGEDPEEDVVQDRERSFSLKPVRTRMLIVFAGPLFNLLFAVGLFYLVYLIGVPALLATVGTVEEGFPAAAAGIRPGDRIVAIDDRNIETWEELTEIVHRSAGQAKVFVIARGEEQITYRIEPRSSQSRNIFGEEVEVGLIGITPAEEFMTIRYGPLRALGMSLDRIATIIELTMVGLVKIFQGVVPAKTLAGPIGIMQMAGQQAKMGILNLIFFTAFISVALGLFNLFPIPILDGGHLLFYLIEAVRGKPISLRKREIFQQIGLVVLVSLILFATKNDIWRLLGK